MTVPAPLPVGDPVANPTPAQMPRRRTLAGQTITLELLDAARHGAALYAAAQPPGSRGEVWKCDALNARSRQAALRIGFRYEGIFAKHAIVKGRSRGTAWFSITDDEWPCVRRNLEAWLNEARDPRPSLAAVTASSQGDAFGQARV